MNASKLLPILFAALLPTAAFADEIGSGEIDPRPGTTSTTTAPMEPTVEDSDTAGTTAEGESLLQQLLDWIA